MPKSYTPHELKVLCVRECAATSEVVDTPEAVARYWHQNIPAADWYDPMKEAFVVLLLNTRRKVVGHNLITLGTLDTCTVHAREVFRPAIALAASAIILAHNHPSGDAQPSEADIKTTRDLIRAGQLLRIEVLDHVIIGNTPSSLRAMGYFF